jgi:hypothetical protein
MPSGAELFIDSMLKLGINEIFTLVGDHLNEVLSVAGRRGMLRLGPLGTIGSALPNSIALQMANPDSPVVMITGDGSLGFYLAELDTVACELRSTRYDLVMKGFGGEGENIDRLDQVAPAVRRAFHAKKPYLLNVTVIPNRSLQTHAEYDRVDGGQTPHQQRACAAVRVAARHVHALIKPVRLPVAPVPNASKNMARLPIGDSVPNHTVPNRNDPCWCGSGRKYKQCHLRVDEIDARENPHPDDEPPRTDFERMLLHLLKFMQPYIGHREMDQAKGIFFGDELAEDPDQIPSFVDWLIHDYKPKQLGERIITRFLAEQSARLPEQDRLLANQWALAQFSLFEVLRTDRGTGLELEDLLLGGRIFVHDVTSSLSLHKWDTLLTRVVPEKDKYVFTGNGINVGPHFKDKLLDWIRRDKASADLDWPEYLHRNSHLIRREAYRLGRESIANLKLVNAEGDPVEFTKVFFRVKDPLSASQKLQADPLLGHPEEKDGELSLAWFETPEGPDSRRVLGNLRLSGNNLTLEVASARRAARGTKLLRSILGKDLRETGQESTDMEDLKRKAMEKGPPAPKQEETPEMRAMLQEVINKHYQTWPDTPLPALNGMTPREASKSPVARGMLETLLRQMENGEARDRQQGRPAYDFSRVRRELGMADHPSEEN